MLIKMNYILNKIKLRKNIKNNYLMLNQFT